MAMLVVEVVVCNVSCSPLDQNIQLDRNIQLDISEIFGFYPDLFLQKSGGVFTFK